MWRMSIWGDDLAWDFRVPNSEKGVPCKTAGGSSDGRLLMCRWVGQILSKLRKIRASFLIVGELFMYMEMEIIKMSSIMLDWN